MGRPGPKTARQRRQPIAGDVLRWTGHPDGIERFGIDQCRCVQHLPSAIRVEILRDIELIHARIQRHPNVQRFGRLACVFGDCHQGINAQHRLAGAQRQSLGHRARRAQAREGAGSATKGNRVELVQADPGGVQHRHHRGQQLCGRLRTAGRVMRPGLRPGHEADRHLLRRCIEREQGTHAHAFGRSAASGAGQAARHPSAAGMSEDPMHNSVTAQPAPSSIWRPLIGQV